MARVSIFLIAVALIVGIVACEEQPPISEIRTWYDLDAIRDNLGGHYILINDLDSTTEGYEELASETANGGKGWQPIGTWTPPDDFRGLTGTFDGQGHEIRDLFINRPFESLIGLFSIVNAEGVIESVGVVVNATASNSPDFGSLVGRNMGTVSDSYSSGRVAGFVAVGGLVGRNYGGTISNSYFTGTVTGSGLLGGLVGWNTDGIVRYSYATGNVTGGDFVGGLMGENGGTVSGSYFTGSVTGNTFVGGLVGRNDFIGTVNDSYSTGTVTGSKYVGGLAGRSNGDVSNSYSTGSATGESQVGGLVGFNDMGTVNNSYSTGSVTGSGYVGGLVGLSGEHSVVSNSYSTGSVTGDANTGGLVGFNDGGTVSNSYSRGSVSGGTWAIGGLVGNNQGTVSDSYATGSVTGSSHVGGLVGFNDGRPISNSFWDTETSGQATSDGGTGKTTAEMQDISTFSDTETEGLDESWDIIAVANTGTRNPAYIWNIVNYETYPFLSWQE